MVPDGHADAIHAIEFETGADAIERRIYLFCQVQRRIAGQVFGSGELARHTWVDGF